MKVVIRILLALGSELCNADLGYTRETSFSLNELNDPRKKIIPENYELIRSEQISASAVSGNGDKIRYESLSDLIGESLMAEIDQIIYEKVRLADVAKWHTFISRPQRRLDRFLNYAATFLSTSRAEGLFQLYGSLSNGGKIKISPIGIEDRTRDFILAKQAIHDSYHQALKKYEMSSGNSEWEKDFRSPSRSIYEYRDDLICGQVKISYEALRNGLVSTQKYLNFRIPITLARVHLLSSNGRSSLSSSSLGPSAVVSRSDWKGVSAKSLEIIQLDESGGGGGGRIEGSEIMNESEESRQMSLNGCHQAEMISREGFTDHCVHLGNNVSRLLRDQSSSPGLTYALKCAALYPNKSIHISRRFREYITGGDPGAVRGDPGAASGAVKPVPKVERESLIVVNFCINKKWTRDFPLENINGEMILRKCQSQDYQRPVDYIELFNEIQTSLQS